MGNSHNKTNQADRDRAKGQSAFEDSKTAGSDEGLKTTDSGEKTRIDAANSSEQDSDWNFSSGSTGMAKETKIGLALCVLLIGAFSFVVYSKMNKQPRLEDEFIAGTDSSSDDAPPPFDDGTHADFGGEPGHHHGHGHDHGHAHGDDEPFRSDSETTADNFDVPQRRRRHQHGDEFAQTADTRNRRGRDTAADPWQSSQANPARDRRHTSDKDDPFSEASHRHTHNDARQTQHEEPAFGDESEFGFEQDKPAKKPVEVKPEKKAWNLADFLGGKDKETEKPAPPPQQQGDGQDDPFGVDAVDALHAKKGQHDHDHQHGRQQSPNGQADDFNPFASTEKAADAHDHGIQQSAGRTVVDGNDRENAFGDDQEFDSWGSEPAADSNGFAGTQQTTGGQSGSQTQVQQSADEFGFEQDTLVDSNSRDQSNHFGGGKFRETPAAPEPDRQLGRGEFGEHGHFSQDDPHKEHDSFSQPFAGGDDHHHDDHQHADDGHFLPNPDGAAGHDRPEVYVVEKGDNFWDISRKKYRAGRYYKALALYNRERIPDPRKMRPGMKVLIPRPEVLVARFPALCPWQTAKPTGHVDHSHHTESGFFTNTDGQPRYRVGSRDTLTEIAKDHLGRASRWVQVYGLNRDRIADPAKLRIGTILRLPADASRVQLVRRSRNHR